MTNKEFYQTLEYWHEKYVPSLRFGQFILDFFNWYEDNFKNDVFYVENKNLLYQLNNYLSTVLKVKERDDYPYA